ncbi:HEPN domain-containing protein [Candidatus Parcubacteria bacterium]|nr:HEPN domain-containing protein [Candidatus Parcubacteria bacterium]
MVKQFMKELNLKDVQEWFDIGNNEFGFACLGLDDEQDKFYAQVCFLFQQAIEKYLKGYLTAHNIKFEKTHDLGYLCQKCSNINKEFGEFIKDCEMVTQYYIPSRYPVHWPGHTREQAEKGHKIAEKIIGFVKGDLGLE